MKKISSKGSGMYILGYKLCSTCEKFIEWDEPRCPCCGQKLRNKPRDTSGRDLFSSELIFKNFETELNLNSNTIEYAKKLFKKLKKRIPFKFQTPIVVISTCVFLASRIKNEPKSIEVITKVAQTRKDILELTCDIALDELKKTLVKGN